MTTSRKEHIIKNNKSFRNEEIQHIVQLYSQGKFQQSLIEANEMLIMFPNSVTLLNIIGAINSALKKFDNAINCYQKAICLKPNFAEAYNNMGVAKQNNGELVSAIECYKKAVKININYVEAFKIFVRSIYNNFVFFKKFRRNIYN